MFQLFKKAAGDSVQRAKVASNVVQDPVSIHWNSLRLMVEI